jgi:hydroxymethylpyrimidine pyrophosphatase-like HAD family hydrolase
MPALRVLATTLPADCHGQYSHRNYLEITALGVDKATALQRLCRALLIDVDAVAAIGDGENDIALLRVAGTGVAMGQAGTPVQLAADWVTDTNDRDGVALAIDRLLSDDVPRTVLPGA